MSVHYHRWRTYCGNAHLDTTKFKGLMRYGDEDMFFHTGVFTFQRFMNKYLTGLDDDYCLIYMNDLIVFSMSEWLRSDHSNTKKNWRHSGIWAERPCCPEKYTIFKQKIKFLGHQFSTPEVRPDESSVDHSRKISRRSCIIPRICLGSWPFNISHWRRAASSCEERASVTASIVSYNSWLSGQ